MEYKNIKQIHRIYFYIYIIKYIQKKLETYTYDTVGNRLIGPKQNHQYTSNANNQITQIQNSNNQTQNTTYTYDNNGNRYIETETNQDGVTTTTYYSYDYEGRLTKVEIHKNNTVKIITFTYDPFGRRISKTVQKDIVDDNEDPDLLKTTYYVYDNEDIIMEYNQRGKITAAYIHGLGIDEPLAMEKNSSTYFYHADGLGSVVALTDSSGNVVQKYVYDSFGNITSVLNPNFIQPYTFTGREYDPENGTYHYRARTFDQKTGTFISKDPIGFEAGDVNLYRYVGNNPVNYIDPYGKELLLFGRPWFIARLLRPYRETGIPEAEWYKWAEYNVPKEYFDPPKPPAPPVIKPEWWKELHPEPPHVEVPSEHENKKDKDKKCEPSKNKTNKDWTKKCQLSQCI